MCGEIEKKITFIRLSYLLTQGIILLLTARMLSITRQLSCNFFKGGNSCIYHLQKHESFLLRAWFIISCAVLSALCTGLSRHIISNAFFVRALESSMETQLRMVQIYVQSHRVDILVFINSWSVALFAVHKALI